LVRRNAGPRKKHFPLQPLPARASASGLEQPGPAADLAKMTDQLSFFAAKPALPEGLVYRDGLITQAEELDLGRRFATLEFRPFEFQGYLGKRRVVFFGWHYDFNDRALGPAEPIPDFLLPLRERAGAFAGVAPDVFPHALITEYAPGAGIGWHRDRPDFHEVVGISLLTPCSFRFRRRAGAGWERASFLAAPRSAYILRGEARNQWEHSIPPLETLRYSVTFRSLKEKAKSE
jgi:alkylated DNA repair dioxygenase AlkB